MSSSDGFGILVSLSIIVGVILATIRAIINRNKPQETTVAQPKINDKDNELNKEDSEGDGLFLGDPMFPEEFDD